MSKAKRLPRPMVVTNDCQQLHVTFVLNGREQVEFQTVGVCWLGHAAGCVFPQGARLRRPKFKYAKPGRQLPHRSNFPSLNLGLDRPYRDVMCRDFFTVTRIGHETTSLCVRRTQSASLMPDPQGFAQRNAQLRELQERIAEKISRIRDSFVC